MIVVVVVVIPERGQGSEKGDRKAPRALTALAHNLCPTFGEAPTKFLTRTIHALYPRLNI